MSCPIGVFDSGYGGLTILKDIVKEMPEYDYIYLGDNARTPYELVLLCCLQVHARGGFKVVRDGV